jgi:hypothetical protein
MLARQIPSVLAPQPKAQWDVQRTMRNDPVTKAERSKIDWKGIGYLFSIAGVLLLGARSWPKPGDPSWFWPALIGGVVTSLIGFGLRYLSHLKERRQIDDAEAKADGKAAPPR